MTKENNQNKLKQIIDNLLLINLFTVIFFAIFFIFAIIMQLNGIFIFINFIQIVWNPLVVPLITILIIGALVNGINSCLLYTSPSPRDKRQSRMPSSA